MDHFDCIIVGGGPAGASAAYNLAEKNVLVLDKDRFPRYKPCAGGITLKIYNKIPFKINSLFDAYEINFIHKKKIKLHWEKPVTYMVQRKDFDNQFLIEAEKKGAKVRFEKVEKLSYKNKFIITTNKNTYSSDFLIGADGANSIVNRQFNIVQTDDTGLAVETDIPVKNPQTFKMTFDFSAVKNGYGWIFPKDKHLCVGIAVFSKNTSDAVSKLKQYCKKHNLVPTKITGHLLPFYGVKYKQPEFPCILCGDAAGFVDAITGEGISYSIKSGKIAAETIGRKNFQEYLQKRYDKEIIAGLKIPFRFKKFFYGNIGFSMTFIKLTKRFIIKFADGRTYDEMIPWTKKRH